MIPIADDTPIEIVPWATYLLIGINVLVFVYQFLLGRNADAFLASCGFIPAEVLTGQDAGVPACVHPVYLTIFTAMFMHAGLLHIGANMLFLWIFGNNVEDAIGSAKFLLFYLACGVVAALVQIYFTVSFTPDQAGIPNVGASGAIAGVLGGYLLLYPHARVRTLIAIGFFWTMTWVPALLVLGLWFVLQFLSGLGSLGATSGADSGGVAFWAHVGGFVAGLVLVRFFGRRVRSRHAHPAYRF